MWRGKRKKRVLSRAVIAVCRTVDCPSVLLEGKGEEGGGGAAGTIWIE